MSELHDLRKKVFIKTFGCQMNEYDTQKLFKILESDYVPISEPQNADLVLINTCSVRDKPEHKLYSLLGELKPLKDENPDLLIGVGGCVAQQEGSNIVDRSKVVDFVFGTHNLSLVPSLIQLRKNGHGRQVAVDYRDEWEDLPLGFADTDPTRNSQRGHVTAFVSISRGCNKSCTYCIVPVTRGPEVSRSVEEIEREVRIAAHRGTKEILLLGQTVNSYGLDLSPRLKFTGLIDRLSQIAGIERIRFVSPHPQEVRDDFLDLITTNPKVCHHIHMPLQSGSDKILKAMNRNYRRSRYLEIIKGLKERVPDISITTDVIVGFPGETDEDFEESMEMLETVRFNASYSFVFSPRPGTAAAAMKEELTNEQKLSRLYRLQARQEQITDELLKNWVGKTGEVLIDGHNPSQPECLQGRLSQNILVNMAQPYSGLKLGDIVSVKVLAANRFSLIAEPFRGVPKTDNNMDLLQTSVIV